MRSAHLRLSKTLLQVPTLQELSFSAGSLDAVRVEHELNAWEGFEVRFTPQLTAEQVTASLVYWPIIIEAVAEQDSNLPLSSWRYGAD